MTVVEVEGQIPSKPAPLGDIDPVIDAMRTVQTETDLWRLAEQLLTLIPKGEVGFQEIEDRAKSEGLAEQFSVNTLRLYRDTARRWPKTKRVPLVSFSAHREAMGHKDGIDAAAKLLKAQVTTVGSPGKVTLKDVRAAVKAVNGKAPAAGKSAATTGSQHTTMAKVIEDVQAGGKQFVAAIPAGTDLDSLHAGLTKIISHVERLRSKAAKAKATAKAPAKAAAPKANGAVKRPATAKGEAGDLRGL